MEYFGFFLMAKGLSQPVGATKAWSTRILEPTDHISRVGQDSEVTKSTRSVVVANPGFSILSAAAVLSSGPLGGRNPLTQVRGRLTVQMGHPVEDSKY